MAASGLPFDDIRNLLKLMPDASQKAEAARAATIPSALGRLGEAIVLLAAWQDKPQPTIDHPLVAVFAGTHGLTKRAAADTASARAALDELSSGGSLLARICGAQGIGLKAFELALEIPTADITERPAMDEAHCAATIAFGMEAVAGDVDVLCLADIGPGNDVAAAAICAALCGGKGGDWLDASDAGKIACVDSALATHRDHLSDPLDVLRRLGGREIAALAGAILAARMQRVPVLLDGFVVCAAALVLKTLDPQATDHCLAAHVTPEPAHRRLLEALGKAPLLDLKMPSGGAGASVALGILKTAIAASS